jgi:hypothetical protein
VRERADRARIDRLLRTIGSRLRRPVQLYLIGGTIVVDRGLRADTFDVGFVVRADDPAAIDEFERLIPILKDELQTNLEPASPADFIPVPSNVLDRAEYVRNYGQFAVYHYDLPTTIISKIARAAERDLADVEALVRSGAVSWDDVESTWREIRDSERGWLRHSRQDVERRLGLMRERLSPPA